MPQSLDNFIERTVDRLLKTLASSRARAAPRRPGTPLPAPRATISESSRPSSLSSTFSSSSSSSSSFLSRNSSDSNSKNENSNEEAEPEREPQRPKRRFNLLGRRPPQEKKVHWGPVTETFFYTTPRTTRRFTLNHFGDRQNRRLVTTPVDDGDSDRDSGYNEQRYPRFWYSTSRNSSDSDGDSDSEGASGDTSGQQRRPRRRARAPPKSILKPPTPLDNKMLIRNLWAMIVLTEQRLDYTYEFLSGVLAVGDDVLDTMLQAGEFSMIEEAAKRATQMCDSQHAGLFRQGARSSVRVRPPSGPGPDSGPPPMRQAYRPAYLAGMGPPTGASARASPNYGFRSGPGPGAGAGAGYRATAIPRTMPMPIPIPAPPRPPRPPPSAVPGSDFWSDSSSSDDFHFDIRRLRPGAPVPRYGEFRGPT